MKRKKYFVLCLLFALTGFFAGCSSDGGSSKKAAVTVEADGAEVNSLSLYSGQKVNLKAILKDKNGNEVENYTTAWTCDYGIGTFSVNNSSETVFTAMSGYTVFGSWSITADCSGTKKKVAITGVNRLDLSYSIVNDLTTPSGRTIRFTASVTVGGAAVENAEINWESSAGSGSFSPNPSRSGDEVAYYTSAFSPGLQLKAYYKGSQAGSVRP